MAVPCCPLISVQSVRYHHSQRSLFEVKAISHVTMVCCQDVRTTRLFDVFLQMRTTETTETTLGLTQLTLMKEHITKCRNSELGIDIRSVNPKIKAGGLSKCAKYFGHVDGMLKIADDWGSDRDGTTSRDETWMGVTLSKRHLGKLNPQGEIISKGHSIPEDACIRSVDPIRPCGYRGWNQRKLAWQSSAIARG